MPPGHSPRQSAATPPGRSPSRPDHPRRTAAN
jgi:hypothetical protein